MRPREYYQMTAIYLVYIRVDEFWEKIIFVNFDMLL